GGTRMSPKTGVTLADVDSRISYALRLLRQPSPAQLAAREALLQALDDLDLYEEGERRKVLGYAPAPAPVCASCEPADLAPYFNNRTRERYCSRSCEAAGLVRAGLAPLATRQPMWNERIRP